MNLLPPHPFPPPMGERVAEGRVRGRFMVREQFQKQQDHTDASNPLFGDCRRAILYRFNRECALVCRVETIRSGMVRRG